VYFENYPFKQSKVLSGLGVTVTRCRWERRGAGKVVRTGTGRGCRKVLVGEEKARQVCPKRQWLLHDLAMIRERNSGLSEANGGL